MILRWPLSLDEMVYPTNFHMGMNMTMMMTCFVQGATTIVERRTLGTDIIVVKPKLNKGHTQRAILHLHLAHHVLLTQTEPGDNMRGVVRLPAGRDMLNG